MRIPAALLALAILVPGPAAALTVEGISDTELRQHSAALADHAGSSQWQQLWYHSRQHGRFAASGAQPRFTLPMREIPGLVRQTLATPDQLHRRSATSTYLRRDFSPRVTGQTQGQPLTAVCLWVDWRGAPERRAGEPMKPSDLLYVSLAMAEPC